MARAKPCSPTNKKIKDLMVPEERSAPISPRLFPVFIRSIFECNHCFVFGARILIVGVWIKAGHPVLLHALDELDNNS